MTTGSAESSDWRSDLLAHLRDLILTAEPEIIEEIKWRKPSNPLGVVAWSLNGLICTGETYKDKVKLTFAKGAALDDPEGLFTSSLEAKVRRAIDLHAHDTIHEAAFQALIKAAAAQNLSRQVRQTDAA